METYNITTTANIVRIDFDAGYFFANCADATIDFDELNINPTFVFVFVDDSLFNVTTDFEPIDDSSRLEQLFNADVLAALIAADARFDF